MSSLRWRTAIAFATLSAVVAGSLSVIVYQTSVRDRAARIRLIAVQRARAAALVYGSTGVLTNGATLNDGSAPPALRRSVARGRVASDVVSTQTESLVWAGVPVGRNPTEGVFVTVDAEEDTAALVSLRNTLAVTGSLITLGGALAGLALAASLSRRLRRAAAAASRIAAGELDVRIGGSGEDEVGVLARAVDGMADALAARIEHERRFNADVAHELRTPVTGLLAAAALLPEQDPVAGMVRGRAERLRRLVEDLLEIARLESGEEAADLREVDLRAFADDVAERYPELRASGQGSVRTDPRRLERIVVNLVENALTHGAPPVEMSVSDEQIVITDHGTGYPVDLPSELTDRFVTKGSGAGFGLGLAIATEQARVLGARLMLSNDQANGGGARAVVRLPAVPGARPRPEAEP